MRAFTNQSSSLSSFVIVLTLTFLLSCRGDDGQGEGPATFSLSVSCLDPLREDPPLPVPFMLVTVKNEDAVVRASKEQEDGGHRITLDARAKRDVEGADSVWLWSWASNWHRLEDRSPRSLTLHPAPQIILARSSTANEIKVRTLVEDQLIVQGHLGDGGSACFGGAHAQSSPSQWSLLHEATQRAPDDVKRLSRSKLFASCPSEYLRADALERAEVIGSADLTEEEPEPEEIVMEGPLGYWIEVPTRTPITLHPADGAQAIARMEPMEPGECRIICPAAEKVAPSVEISARGATHGMVAIFYWDPHGGISAETRRLDQRGKLQASVFDDWVTAVAAFRDANTVSIRATDISKGKPAAVDLEVPHSNPSRKVIRLAPNHVIETGHTTWIEGQLTNHPSFVGYSVSFRVRDNDAGLVLLLPPRWMITNAQLTVRNRAGISCAQSEHFMLDADQDQELTIDLPSPR